MNKTLVILVYLLSLNIFAADNNPVLELSFMHSMRIDNHHVSILIKNNNVTIIEKNRDDGENSRTVNLTEQQIKTLKKLQKNINFESNKPEYIIGVDGHTIVVTSRGKSISVWVPSYDTEKRRLGNFLKLSQFVFKISGLSNEALPVK